MKEKGWLLIGSALLVAVWMTMVPFAANAKSTTIMFYRTAKQGHGEKLGTVTFRDTRYGLLLMPHLSHLTPGLHGFHIHILPNCNDFGEAAGGHWDPKHTGRHLGPYDDRGHLGDLPALYVDQNGNASLPILAPRLKADELKRHAIIIHQHGDNYRDKPALLGGGGARIACAIG